MIEYIIYITAACAVVLFIVVSHREKKRKLEQERKRREIATRIKQMRVNYRASIDFFAGEHILPVQHKGLFYAVLNNFFVYQPINEENVSHCESLLNDILDQMGQLFRLVPKDGDVTAARAQVSKFIDFLPATNKGYDVDFYHNELPELIKILSVINVPQVMKSEEGHPA